MVFSILGQLKLQPEPAEAVGEGGVDFCCRPNDASPFLVEVTAVPTEKVTQKSGLPPPGTSHGGLRDVDVGAQRKGH